MALLPLTLFKQYKFLCFMCITFFTFTIFFMWFVNSRTLILDYDTDYVTSNIQTTVPITESSTVEFTESSTVSSTVEATESSTVSATDSTTVLSTVEATESSSVSATDSTTVSSTVETTESSTVSTPDSNETAVPHKKQSKILSPEWDILVLAENWLPTLNSQLKNANWTIHGLWPSTTSGPYPADCTNDPFKVEELTSIIQDMTLYWPTYKVKTGNITQDSLDFWEHEWSKHGTCALELPEIIGQLEYFTQGLKLHKQFNILGILEKSGIEPDNLATYTLEEIENGFKKEISVTPVVVCSGKKIEEIRICLDLDWQAVDCTEASTCSKTGLKYPLP